MRVVFESYHWRRFTQAECCVSLYDRGGWFAGESFVQVVGRGAPGPRHMSVGRFRAQEAGRVGPETPCWIPWTILEPEEGDLVDRWDAARTLIETLEAEGIETERVRVRFSGNASWWVCLPGGMMGNPIATVADQRRLRERVFRGIAETRLDENLWDARHLARLVGSLHEKGGEVRSWPAWVFMEARLGELLSTRWDEEPPPGPVPPDPVLTGLCRRKAVFHVPAPEDVPRQGSGLSVVTETEDGVSEGDRNYTAFRRGCALLRRLDFEAALSELLEWNVRNDPPLPEREVRACLQSARRTIEFHERTAA